MKLIETIQKLTVEETHIYKLDKSGLCLKVYYRSSNKDGDDLSLQSAELFSGKAKYSYMTPDFIKKSAQHHFYDDNDGQYWWRDYTITNLFREFSDNKLDLERVIKINFDNHSFEKYNGEYVETLIHSNYDFYQTKKGKYSGKYLWNWNALKEHIKNFPGVVNFEEFEVPGYNQDFSGQRQLEFDIRFKKEWFVLAKGSSWSRCLMGDIPGFDPLNVNQFKLPK